jgi:hypothetical protein
VRLEGLGKLKNFNDFVGSRTHDIPPCSILLQPITPPHVPMIIAWLCNLISTFNVFHILQLSGQHCEIMGPTIKRKANSENGFLNQYITNSQYCMEPINID